MNKKRKAFWLKQLHQWHWITSALCLISLLLFSLTGITLNHASAIHADPAVQEQEALLPTPLRQQLALR
ncbi:PepSY-associated TM helix domain-containing protein, partial [Alcanivorax sp. HI0033]